jgi:uncharacterized protein YjgD (DUF1641 family)
MAKAIGLVPVPSHNQEGAREELQRRIAAAPVEHAEALLSAWELLQMAEDRQVLDMAKGLLGSADNLVERLAAGANTPGAIRAMRNGLLLAELLGSVDPEVLTRLLKALPSAVADGTKDATAEKPPSLWSSLRGFMSVEGRRTLGLLSGITVAVGSALGDKKKKD